MKKVIVGILVLQCLIFANADKLYKPCIACHGANGENVANGVSGIIKDMSKEDFIAALRGYKDGTYGGKLKALMKGQVMRLSEDDFKDLAEKIVK